VKLNKKKCPERIAQMEAVMEMTNLKVTILINYFNFSFFPRKRSKVVPVLN
jgi:hypothetical protein